MARGIILLLEMFRGQWWPFQGLPSFSGRLQASPLHPHPRDWQAEVRGTESPNFSPSPPSTPDPHRKPWNTIDTALGQHCPSVNGQERVSTNLTPILLGPWLWLVQAGTLLSGGGIPVASLNHSCVFVMGKAVFAGDRDGVAPALCSLESYLQKKPDNYHLPDRRVLFCFVLSCDFRTYSLCSAVSISGSL